MAVSPSLRQLVWERAGARCEYCHMPSGVDVLPFCIDHVVPRKHGGATNAENLALACSLCNRFKLDNFAGIDPATLTIAPLFHPRLDTWNHHFSWDKGSLIGLTATGLATISVLRINLALRVEHRENLLLLGKFPLN